MYRIIHRSLQEGSYLIQVICVCLRKVVSNSYCVVVFCFVLVVFVFVLLLVYGGVQHILCFYFVCLLVNCVPSVASFPGLSILDCPFGFSKVYLQEMRQTISTSSQLTNMVIYLCKVCVGILRILFRGYLKLCARFLSIEKCGDHTKDSRAN